MAKKDSSGLVPTDLAQEYAEIGADKLVEEAKEFIPALDSLGSELPYVKTAIAAIKFPRTLGDYLLGRKVYAFLYSSGLSLSKIDKFKNKFSKVKQERLWQRVVFSINAHDDELKSQIIGKLFNALIEEFIEEDEFFTLVHATNSLNVHTLERLKELYNLSYTQELSGSQYYSFATLGLIEIDNSTVGTLAGGGPRYPLNQLGWKYVGIVFGFPDSSIGGLKIGEGVLISELDENGQITNRAYPLSHLQTKGSRYRELNLFVVTQDGRILCDSGSGLPLIVATKVIPAGHEPNMIARQLAAEYADLPIGISTRNMEDAKVQRWSFMVKGEPTVAGGVYRGKADIMEQLINEPLKTDETRYYVDVVEQIGRHTDGELSHIWNNAQP